MEIEKNISKWMAISCPVKGVRFDEATLKQLDSDGDGRIRTPEVLAAVEALKADEKNELLEEFVDNFVTMGRLYAGNGEAIFQLGTLRIAGREMNLCFNVDDEEAHSALVGESKCCVIYLKLTRPNEETVRSICAVVTAGALMPLYVGRNGVFYDRDGKDWEAVITRVVEAQISLVEAFFAPWKKIGEGIAGAVKKFLGDKQESHIKSLTNVAVDGGASTLPTAPVGGGASTLPAGAQGESGAAMASSVAAIGIGVGMVGAALASLLAVVTRMSAPELGISVAALILVVSMPSVIITWFNLRKRDLGGVLNASGWAINRPMRFSMRLARAFTKVSG